MNAMAFFFNPSTTQCNNFNIATSRARSFNKRMQWHSSSILQQLNATTSILQRAVLDLSTSECNGILLQSFDNSMQQLQYCNNFNNAISGPSGHKQRKT